jgi:sulfite reductase (ferredoxin)
MSKANVEQVKAESHGLRGALEAELQNSDAFLSEAGQVLIKFHGSYQQQDRDTRKGGTKDYSFMIRSKLPGGQLTAAQYLVHDDIASAYGNETLRITTRQGIQFHGVIKSDLRNTIRQLNHALVTTFGACGDVVRNVMACPAPTADPQRRIVQDYATIMSNELLPRTKAYHQIWVDGQELIDDEEPEDNLYGKTYLPRKFKMAIAFPGDNCVDIYTNDVGLVALFDDAQQLIGFNILAGGGMGTTHNNEETFARLADVIGFVTPDQALEAVKAIVTIHRDFGDRTNRKHARLKYILHDRGVAWFREELQRRVPFAVQDARPMPEFAVLDHLGWQEQGDGKLYLGVPIENGRIADRGAYRLRTGLRAIIAQFDLPVRLTAQQNLLLADIRPEDRPAIEALLSEYGIILLEQISGVRRLGLACPALPTCGLAITEAERALPGVLDEIEDDLEALGLPDAPITIRMTGCPNGCARPFVSEVAFVGRSLNKYMIYLGGAANGTRLARPFIDLIPLGQLAPTLRPLFEYYRDARTDGETFGDFADRIGFDALRERLNVAQAAQAAD